VSKKGLCCCKIHVLRSSLFNLPNVSIGHYDSQDRFFVPVQDDYRGYRLVGGCSEGRRRRNRVHLALSMSFPLASRPHASAIMCSSRLLRASLGKHELMSTSTLPKTRSSTVVHSKKRTIIVPLRSYFGIYM
jgi:hypothetical protein